MTGRRRLIISVAVAGLAAWGLWLAPLERPRAVLREVDAHWLSFSPDSQLVATGEHFDEKGTRIRIWRVADGKHLTLLYDGGEELIDFTFSPDGREAAAISETGVVVAWDTATAQERLRVTRPSQVKKWLNSPFVLYSRTGTLQILDPTSLEQEPPLVRLIDAAQGHETLTLALPNLGPEPWISMAPSGQRRWLMAVMSKRLVCVDLMEGRIHADFLTPFVDGGSDLSADGKVFLGGSSNSVCSVANVSDGKWLKVKAMHSQGVRGLSPTGAWLAGDLGAFKDPPWYARWLNMSPWSLGVVHLPDGQEVVRYPGGSHVKFSPDGATLAVFSDNDFTVQLWDFPPRKAWGWIIGGAIMVGLTGYLLLSRLWRWRRHGVARTLTSGPIA